MMTIPRGLARSFRAVIRKCQTARPRPPAPPVLVEVRDGHLHLACVLDGVGVVLSVPAAECEIERVLVPMDILDAVEGALVEIAVSSRMGTARWESRDGPKTQSFNLNETAEQAVGPVVPAEMHSVAPTFLTALHECGRTAAREPARYALHRVQVNGKTGTVAASDGKLALVQRGFKLPFRDAVLVPALPLFGVKELASETDVRSAAKRAAWSCKPARGQSLSPSTPRAGSRTWPASSRSPPRPRPSRSMTAMRMNLSNSCPSGPTQAMAQPPSRST